MSQAEFHQFSTFVLIALMIVSVAGIALAGIRLESRRLTARRPEDERTVELLTAENGKLIDQVGRLEERIAVLERIATDTGSRLSDRIEALR